ncbi:MAG TPA: NepR family anti-sigma factor [Allosphingosinicella sp.]|nr:NepR family anti-sigma factor [Allosphingosinicella sp.]
MSDSDAKPPAKSHDRRSRKRASGGDVGNALRAAYDDALKEEIPQDLLALLGKLD